MSDTRHDTPEPFKVDIPERALIDLDERLRRWRASVAIADNGSWAAGTDPDFLAELVDDVSELCTRMAIIDRGEILLEAEPLRAVDDLRGRIWRRVISKDELPAVEREHAVISTKLLAGRTLVRVYGEEPATGFEQAEPDLEDVYFSTMAGQIGRRRQQPEPVMIA